MSPKASPAQRPCPKEEEERLKRSSGILHRPGMRPASVREMDEAIGRFHAEEDARIRKGQG
jgi:hypothetical protein